MKKQIFALIICLCMFLTGCTSTTNQNSEETNYNNFYRPADFWPHENSFYYAKGRTEDMLIYDTSRALNKKIITPKDVEDKLVWPELFVSDESLYFKTRTGQNYDIYRYDPSGEHKKVLEKIDMDNVVMMIGDTAIYGPCNSNSYRLQNDLIICDMLTGQETKLTDQMYSFGVVKGKLQYICYSDVIELFEYDLDAKQTTKLATLEPPQFDNDFLVNFTKNYLVLFSQEKFRCVIYDLKTRQVSTCEMPDVTIEFVACNEYAFAAVMDEYEDDSFDLFRISLSTGETELIEEIEGKSSSQIDIHAVSDDMVYVQLGTMKLSMLWTTTIYKIDVAKGPISKALSY